MNERGQRQREHLIARSRSTWRSLSLSASSSMVYVLMGEDDVRRLSDEPDMALAARLFPADAVLIAEEGREGFGEPPSERCASSSSSCASSKRRRSAIADRRISSSSHRYPSGRGGGVGDGAALPREAADEGLFCNDALPLRRTHTTDNTLRARNDEFCRQSGRRGMICTRTCYE